jgi:sugar O-acyltransferase (sialic acid O-acetyltransferase NeuD family)
MSTRNLIIISAGKFAREVYVWARQAIDGGAPWAIKGFLDDRPDQLQGFRYPAPIVDSVENYEPRPGELFLNAVGEPALKGMYSELVEARGGEFATLIHPTALVGHDVLIGAGSILGPYTQLSCDIRLGRHVVFGTHSNTAHDTRIGDYSHVCGSVELNGGVEIGRQVFVGSHATLIPNVKVGDDAYIGAGSVVLKNVKAGVKVFGNPAVAIGRVEGY